MHKLGGDAGPAAGGDGLVANDIAGREAAWAGLAARVSPTTEGRLSGAVAEARAQVAAAADLAAVLRLHLTSPDPYLRAAAFYLIESMDGATEADRTRLAGDEHPLVVETATAAAAAASGEPLLESSTLEKMIGLTSIGVFADLEPEDLAHLGRAGVETWYPQDSALCTEGEVADDVSVVLDGKSRSCARSAGGTRVLSVEGPGSCIGELAVLDPARAKRRSSRRRLRMTLRLSGSAFRQALGKPGGVGGRDPHSGATAAARRRESGSRIRIRGPEPNPGNPGTRNQEPGTVLSAEPSALRGVYAFADAVAPRFGRCFVFVAGVGCCLQRRRPRLPAPAEAGGDCLGDKRVSAEGTSSPRTSRPGSTRRRSSSNRAPICSTRRSTASTASASRRGRPAP